MKKIEFTNETDVRLGFEVECVIRSRRRLIRKLREIQRGITVGHDGSINTHGFNDNHTTAEIRTKPEPPKDAIETLGKIFDIVNECGGTNASCGLHVNISSTSRRKMKNFNPLVFASTNLWSEILKRFRRGGNRFCRPVFKLRSRRISKVNILSTFSNMHYDKYRCVNLSNFANGSYKSSRVEIRGFGNTNYTRKYDIIISYVKRIEKMFNIACEDTPLARHVRV